MWWYFRDRTADGARKLFEQGKKVAEGAALMTNTSFEVEVLSAVWPVRTNQTLAQVVQRNIEIVGMPEWTAEEQSFARELQKAAEAPIEGLRTAVKPLDGPAQQRSPSNDCGDVSWVVPMGRVSFPSNIPNVAFHHWAAGSALATSVAHKGAVAGAKTLAGAIVDLLADQSLIEQAKRTFETERNGEVYRPLLPPDQKPPVDLNREMMESFRPKMRQHYVKEKPVFV